MKIANKFLMFIFLSLSFSSNLKPMQQEEQAATIIQDWYREHVARKQSKAARKIQPIVRGWLAREKYLNTKCTICDTEYNRLTENEKVRLRCCKRTLCKKCIDSWARSCPFCRKEPIEYRRIKTGEKITLTPPPREPEEFDFETFFKTVNDDPILRLIILNQIIRNRIRQSNQIPNGATFRINFIFSSEPEENPNDN